MKIAEMAPSLTSIDLFLTYWPQKQSYVAPREKVEDKQKAEKQLHLEYTTTEAPPWNGQ